MYYSRKAKECVFGFPNSIVIVIFGENTYSIVRPLCSSCARVKNDIPFLMRVATSRCHYVGLRRGAVQQRCSCNVPKGPYHVRVYHKHLTGLESGVEAEPAAAVFNTHTN